MEVRRRKLQFSIGSPSGLIFVIILSLLVSTNCYPYGALTVNSPGVQISSYTSGGTTYDFTSSLTFTGDLTIASGTDLLVTGTITMGSGTIIHIEPGAMLELKGGTITGSNTSFAHITDVYSNWWRGIELLGNSNRRQQSVYEIKNHLNSSSDFVQGVFWAHNNGSTMPIIQNSYYGIVVSSMTTSGYTGGVLICESCKFIDNYIQAINIEDYKTNPSSSVPNKFFGNESYVTGCQFSYDALFDGFHYGLTSPSFSRNFIKVIGNLMVPINPQTYSFTYNTFTVHDFTRTYAPFPILFFGDNWTGLYIEETTVAVFSNTFNDLFYGVYDNTYTQAGGQLGLINNTFNLCTYSIYNGGSTNSNVQQNNINSMSGYGWEPGYIDNSEGIYMDGVEHSMTVLNNVYKGSYTPAGASYGIYDRNLGKFGESLFGNFMANQNYGATAEGNNSGLVYVCNAFSAANQDILVGPSGGYSTTPLGVSPLQGDPTLVVTNSFDHAGSTKDWYQNGGVANVKYYYPSGSPSYPSDASVSVSTIPISLSASGWPITTALCIANLYPQVTSSIKTVVSSINTAQSGLPVPPSGTADQIAEYNDLTLQKEYCIGMIEGALMEPDSVSASPDSMQSLNHVQSVINYLHTVNDAMVDFDLIPNYILEYKFDSAGFLIDTLTSRYPGDSDVITRCSYYTILINGMENNFNSTWFSSYGPTLEVLAAKSHPIQATAQGLLQYLQDITINEVPDDTPSMALIYNPTFITPDGGAGPPIAGIKTQDKSSLTITAYPDPLTGDMLQVKMQNNTTDNEEIRIVISDELGKIYIDQVYHIDLGCDVNQKIDVGTLAKGSYILAAYNKTNQLYKQIIIKP